jgi:hypothetical protein
MRPMKLRKKGTGDQEELIDRSFIEACDRAERPGDQMQFVLNDQIGWIKRPTVVEWPALTPGLGGTIEAKPLSKAINMTEERASFPDPRQTCKLVDRGNQEGGQATIDRLIDGEDRQRTIAGEVTGRVGHITDVATQICKSDAPHNKTGYLPFTAQ